MMHMFLPTSEFRISSKGSILKLSHKINRADFKIQENIVAEYLLLVFTTPSPLAAPSATRAVNTNLVNQHNRGNFEIASTKTGKGDRLWK